MARLPGKTEFTRGRREKMNNNIVYLGDSAKILKSFPEGCIDLTVTSPPYDNLRKYEGYIFDFNTIARELYRVTKQGGMIVWVVGDATINGSETGTSFRQALYFMECGFNLHDTMIYEKNSPSYPFLDKYHQTFEFMFIFSKGKPKTVNLLKDRKNLWGSSWGRSSHRDINGNRITGNKIIVDDTGTRFNIWRYNTGKGFSTKDEFAFEHPAIFPEELARDHILSWSNPNDIVLDCFAGSGTTLKMAKELGRHYIGIEISPTYIELINKRLVVTNDPLFAI
jgi:DNA modification methylase